MRITENLKKVLDEDQLKQLESAIQAVINEQVELKVAEKTAEIEKISEEYVTEAVQEQLNEKTKELETQYAQKLEEFENTVVDNLDIFLENEISEKISDETIAKIAINEALEPVVVGIKKLFAENFLELDSEGSSLIKAANEKVESLTNENTNLIDEKIQLTEKMEKLATKMRIDESLVGLTEGQTIRVKEFFADKSFEEVDGKIQSFVDMILEEKTEKNETINESEKHVDENDHTEDKQLPKNGLVSDANKWM